ncbi:MAG: hypothetical protein AAGE96_01915 [Cyanobacteria bacterium P01_G01_bin.19]
MWKFESKSLQGDRIRQIFLFQNNLQISFEQIIDLWQHNEAFRDYFISLLANTPMQAYFWETPPVTDSNCDRPFEFVLINSMQLAEVTPDLISFRQHFQTATQNVVTFFNLGRDASLVAPCPTSSTTDYAHLASFVRNAPKAQQHLLWQIVGQKLAEKLNDTSHNPPIWLNTSGLGVHWLHIRLDSIPKYYQFQPYRVF